MDAKKILAKVPDYSPKDKISISIDKELLAEFKEVCKQKPLSPVVEAIIRDFVESYKRPKTDT